MFVKCSNMTQQKFCHKKSLRVSKNADLDYTEKFAKKFPQQKLLI